MCSKGVLKQPQIETTKVDLQHDNGKNHLESIEACVLFIMIAYEAWLIFIVKPGCFG